MLDHDVSRIPLQIMQHCVVASIQVDLTEAVLDEFRDDLLQLLQRTNATGVVLDVSGVEVMDLGEFDALRQTTRMAGLMGARAVFSGFRAGVVSSLVELDADICSIEAALNLDAALELLMRTGDIESDGDPEDLDEAGDSPVLGKSPESVDD